MNNIYKYWEKKSLQGALKVRLAILKSPKTILYSEQYQIDDLNPKYRRIVVHDNYKVLYRVEGKVIFIMGIVGTSQSSDIIKEK